MLESVLLGLIVGAVLGLTGAGGGILAIPALVAGMGWTIQQATPVALIAVASSAAIGAAEAFKKRLVRYRAALVMAAAGMPTTWVGSHLAQRVPARVLLALFASVMVLVAIRLLRQAARSGTASSASTHCIGRINPATGRLVWSRPTAIALTIIGAMTGLMTGLLGVGGGFMIVPMLRRFTDISMHAIVATSLCVVALVSSWGIVSALAHGIRPSLDVAWVFSIGTAAGMVAGRAAAHRVTPNLIQSGFAVLLIVVSIGMGIKAAGMSSIEVPSRHRSSVNG
ncbi:sulfite exporter TauE/SafE family protein [Pararobbsia silviterrae]|uniref:Probable membrane transporter protein n=1 Tax=Pararobbsia silviterrae TaxID=1792498 RepID=A0A494YBY3_9BURK|nr:sulfite exporter TauE/SafE family protein [Pararobbsia silviterrae]RKP57790.1 sulfite exporter TauE/SafE family protein [Pararobbsia silviterrae]